MNLLSLKSLDHTLCGLALYGSLLVLGCSDPSKTPSYVSMPIGTRHPERPVGRSEKAAPGPVAANTFTVTFVAGEKGSIKGVATQTVKEGENTTPVEAVPAAEYSFRDWTGDGFKTTVKNPLIIKVTRNLTLKASFMETPSGGDAPHVKHRFDNVQCSACHSGPEFEKPVMDKKYKAKTGLLAYDPDDRTCSGVTCHGGQKTPGWYGKIDTLKNCTACHVGNGEQYNSYKGTHNAHLKFGCVKCHNTTLLEETHFKTLSTPEMEGPAGANIKITIGGKSTYDPATKTCVTACHSNKPIKWKD